MLGDTSSTFFSNNNASAMIQQQVSPKFNDL